MRIENLTLKDNVDNENVLINGQKSHVEVKINSKKDQEGSQQTEIVHDFQNQLDTVMYLMYSIYLNNIDLQDYSSFRDRERRVLKSSVKYGYLDLIAYALSIRNDIGNIDPSTYNECMKGEESKK